MSKQDEECGIQDKNSEAIYGKRWCFLCEEITKLLSSKYQDLK